MKKQIFDAIAGTTLCILMGVPLMLVSLVALVADAIQTVLKRA